MIIVNQDKELIANFDNVEYIWISNPVVNDDDTFKIVAEAPSSNMVIGKYETEERAKEVLKEIVQLFTEEEMFHINKSSLNNLDELAEPKYILRPVSRNKVFYMPKE